MTPIPVHQERGGMSGRRVKTGVVLLALVLAIWLAMLKIHESNRKERLAAEQKAEQEKAAKLDQKRRIAQLASKTNAVTKWREEFSSTGEFLFTADVTRVFVRPDGRPLLFDGAEAQDVAQRGAEFLCYFGVDLSPNNSYLQGNTTARLALSCDPSMAKKMMQRGEGEMYAVVASISAVPSYDEVTTNESSAESSTERRFVVSGTELGQEFLGRHYEFLKLLQRYSPEDLEKQ